MMPTLDAFLQDLRYAVRSLRRSPGFAIVAILSLAIGIGANTAIFSLVNAVLLRPLAIEDPDRVFVVRESLFSRVAPSVRGGGPVNPVHAMAWAEDCPSLEHVALISGGGIQLDAGGEPASFPGAAVSPNLFTLLGVAPIQGRTFAAGEDQAGHERVAVLSESLWRARFGADPSLVGRSILLDGEPYQVIGIVPASLRVPYADDPGQRFDIFRPLVLPPEERTRAMGNFNYAAVTRLARGVRVEQAVAEINVVQARFPRQTGLDVVLQAQLVPAHEAITGRARLGLWMLAGAVGAVLLIVCINLANLLLSRTTTHSREAAIRIALGAGRARLFGQVLTESLLLAIGGGLLGLWLAHQTVRLLTSLTSLDLPRLEDARLDPTVVLFASGVTLLAGLVFGLLPAWRFTRHDPQEALRAGSHTVTEGRGGLRLREGLIGLEVGLSAALLILAGLLTGSLTRLLHVDKGFDVAHVLTLDVDLGNSRYAEPVTRERFFDRLLATVDAVPGVQAAGVITALPTLGETWMDPIYLEGAPRERRHPVNNRYTSPGYFRAMNIAVRRGRPFDEHDRGRGVAVLSEKAAQLLWPGDPDPVGRSFMGEDDKIKTLVGIVADVRATLQNEPPPTAYYPYWQRVPAGAALVVRTMADPRAVEGELRAVLRKEDAQLPIPALRTMEDVVDRSVTQRRFQVQLMTAFAAAALLVASLGIYGVVSYAVARRRNELGIRLALGAQRGRLLMLILRQGMAPIIIGLIVGVAGALALGRAIRGLLFEVQPSDPATIAGVVLVLLVVGISACLIPARRAASLDPVTALRSE